MLEFSLQNIAVCTIAALRYPVRIATTNLERQAIFRFRYEVYCSEFEQRGHPDADHAQRIVRGEGDDDPDTLLFYLGTPERVIGTVRQRVLLPHRRFDDVWSRYSLDRVPMAKATVTCLTDMFMLHPNFRGKLAGLSLLTNSSRAVCRFHPIDLVIADAHPRLINFYCELGFFPYGADFISASNGIAVPLMAVAGDLAALYKVRSPMMLSTALLSLRGRLGTQVPSGLKHLGHTQQKLLLDEDDVQDHLSRFLSRRLSPAESNSLARLGLVLDVEKDVQVAQQGQRDGVAVVVLDGKLGVFQNDERLVAELLTGESFGVETLLDRGAKNKAGTRTIQRSLLLLLRARALRHMVREDPSQAHIAKGALSKLQRPNTPENIV